MHKQIRHTALLLLIFIVYPYLFQAFHILYHDHGNGHVHAAGGKNGHIHLCIPLQNECVHSLEDICHGDETDDPNNTGSGFHDYPGAGSNHCPVCEHEFAKFSFVAIFNITIARESFRIRNTFPYQTPQILYSGNNKSLRAPPAYSRA